MTVEELVRHTALRYGVDPDLAARVAYEESRYNQQALSPAGAVGVMQLLPSTAAGLGVNPYDLADNIRGGVLYLRSLLTRYSGDTRMALTAYHAGPTGAETGRGVGPRTLSYVERILAFLGLGTPAPPSAPAAPAPPPWWAGEPLPEYRQDGGGEVVEEQDWYLDRNKRAVYLTVLLLTIGALLLLRSGAPRRAEPA